MNVKIFGIGLPRTGTFSLATALSKLNYNVKHYPSDLYDLEKYDACTEVRFDPIELRHCYPDCKLILTIRDQKQWLRSCKIHLSKYKKDWNPFWLNPSDWLSMYEKRLQSVIGLDDVLIMNICQGDEWDKLCYFLGKQVPSEQFPNKNKSNAIAMI